MAGGKWWQGKGRTFHALYPWVCKGDRFPYTFVCLSHVLGMSQLFSGVTGEHSWLSHVSKIRIWLCPQMRFCWMSCANSNWFVCHGTSSVYVVMEEIVGTSNVHWRIQAWGFFAFRSVRSLLQFFFLETNLLLQTFTVSYHSKRCFPLLPTSQMCLTLNTAHFQLNQNRNSCRLPEWAWVQYIHPGVTLYAQQQLWPQGFSNGPLNIETRLLGAKCPWHFREKGSAGVPRHPWVRRGRCFPASHQPHWHRSTGPSKVEFTKKPGMFFNRQTFLLRCIFHYIIMRNPPLYIQFFKAE